MSPCAWNNIDKIRTVCVYALFYYAFSHLRKYGWACPSRNGIRIQSDITVSTSNIHEGASGSHRIAENHNAYTQLTRFRAESLYWMAFVYTYPRGPQHAFSLFDFTVLSSVGLIDRLIPKITIHLCISVAYWRSILSFFPAALRSPNVIPRYKAHSFPLYAKRKTGPSNTHRYQLQSIASPRSFHLRTK